jgi:hypothetical protein
MRRLHIKYLGYAISAIAGILIATGAGPKLVVLAIVVVGVALIIIGDRRGHRRES